MSGGIGRPHPFRSALPTRDLEPHRERTPLMNPTTPGARRLTGAALLAAVTLATGAATAMATVDPGTPGKDVHIGRDSDNATNPFIQPPAVAAPQHMNDTDLLFGRGNADLLVGGKGGDTLLGGPGPDILVG